jgi:hypothetical protein
MTPSLRVIRKTMQQHDERALALLEVGKVQSPHLYVFHVSLFSKEMI